MKQCNDTITQVHRDNAEYYLGVLNRLLNRIRRIRSLYREPVIGDCSHNNATSHLSTTGTAFQVKIPFIFRSVTHLIHLI